jgi:hypothetical protein
MQDPWENLTDHEAAALERAEEKYRMLGPQASPRPDSIPLCTAQIFRVNFAAFREGESFLIHADRSRLKPLCEIGQRVWISELAHLVQLLVRADALLRNGATLDDDLEWELQSYGVQLSEGSAIVGYGENSSPLVLNRRLFFGFLQFLADTVRIVDPPGLSASLCQDLNELLAAPPRP